MNEQRIDMFRKAVEVITQKINEISKPVIIVENLLCESHSAFYDEREQYGEIDDIVLINSKLRICYELLEERLPFATVINEEELSDLRFTHDEWRYGLKPYYYNDGYYRHAAYMILGENLR